MTKIRLDYIHEFRDRHGKIRRYVRLPGGKRIPLRGAPGTDEFMEGYRAALAGEAQRVEIGASRTKPGTVNAAVISYFNAASFQVQAPDTRRTRRNILERFRAEHGEKRIALLQRAHIGRMVAAKAGTPSAARNFLNTIRALMAHCIIEGIRADDPTQGVKRVPIKTRPGPRAISQLSRRSIPSGRAPDSPLPCCSIPHSAGLMLFDSGASMFAMLFYICDNRRPVPNW